MMETGCYLLEFTPVGEGVGTKWPAMAGTLRLDAAAASSDLYGGQESFVPSDDPIPVWPRGAHVCHLAHARPPFKGATEATCEIEMRRRDGGERVRLVLGTSGVAGEWVGELRRLQGSPSTGTWLPIGTVRACWLAGHWRTARIHLHQQVGTIGPAAGSNSVEEAWDPGRIFGARWKVWMQEDAVLDAPQLPATWTSADLHEVLSELTQHDNAVYDREWRYRLLRVRALHSVQGYTLLGLMFDPAATDALDVPREGAAVAMEALVPGAAGTGGTGGKLGDNPVLVRRTSLHEVGHLMGLSHRSEPASTGRQRIMATTQDLRNSTLHGATLASAARPEFHSSDLTLLNHRPDLEIRPGGNAFAPGSSLLGDGFGESRWETDRHLRLRVEPVVEEVPLGTPVRLQLRLWNSGRRGVMAPARLGLMTGHVAGWVMRTEPGKRTPPPAARGALRHRFRSLTLPEIADWLQPLAPRSRETRTGSMSLLRGPAGALFPEVGTYTIEVEVFCARGHRNLRVTARCVVRVVAGGGVDLAPARAVLAEPQSHLLLELGGAHLKRGVDVVQRANRESILRPHWRFTEARWKTLSRSPEYREAAEILADPEMVMHAGDVEEGFELLTRIQRGLGASDPLVVRAARALLKRAQALPLFVLPEVEAGLVRMAGVRPDNPDKPRPIQPRPCEPGAALTSD